MAKKYKKGDMQAGNPNDFTAAPFNTRDVSKWSNKTPKKQANATTPALGGMKSLGKSAFKAMRLK